MDDRTGKKLLRYCCFLAAMSLTGCSEFKNWVRTHRVGPDYRKPVAAVSQEWIDFNDPRVISQQQSVNECAWWHTLNDPQLNQIVMQSYEQNLSLRAAGMRVMEARARRGIAAGLLFPQSQEAVGGYSRVQVSERGNAFGLPIVSDRAFDFWSTGLNVGWEVDVWGRFRRNLESADAKLDASIEDYDDILVCLIAETAAAYVEIREFEQRLVYVRQNVESQRASLELAQSRFRNGLTSELDVTQGESNLAQTEALIPQLETGLRESNNRLCVLLGTPPRDLQPELGTAPIPASPAEVVVGIPAELLRRRPDIRRAEREVAAQSAQIGIATADLFPAFSINGSVGWQGTSASDLFTSPANVGAIGPSFNWNILHYGRIRNNILAQDARFQELAILYQETVLKANAEVEDAIVGFLQAQDQVRTLEKGVQASERSVELALIQYREGTTDFNRVFNLQSILFSQQDELAVAQAAVTLSLVRIYKALGGGWQIRCSNCESETLVMPIESSSDAPITAQPLNTDDDDSLLSDAALVEGVTAS